MTILNHNSLRNTYLAPLPFAPTLASPGLGPRALRGYRGNPEWTREMLPTPAPAVVLPLTLFDGTPREGTISISQKCSKQSCSIAY